MKKTILLSAALALAFVSCVTTGGNISQVSDKIDEGDYYVTQFRQFSGLRVSRQGGLSVSQTTQTQTTQNGPTGFSGTRSRPSSSENTGSGGSRSSENNYRPFNTSRPSWIRGEAPSEQDIDRAIAAYEEALRLLPSGTWKPNRSTTLPPEGGIQSRLGNARRIKQQWLAEKPQRDRALAVAQQAEQARQQQQQQQAQAAQQQQQAEQARRQQQEAQRLADEAPNSTPNGPNDFDVAQNTDGGITITNYKGTRKHVVIPDTLYGLKVTSIGARAFFRKGLISVVIPNTVITIENGDTSLLNPELVGAFSQNNLVKVTLGNSLRTIGSFAFYANPLTELTIPDSVTVIDFAAFYQCDIARMTLGRGLRTIGAFAFRSNELVSLSIPSGVTFVGRGAFAGNPLTTLVIPESLAVYSTERGIESFYMEAFSGDRLTRVTLPANFDRRNSSGIDENLMNYYVSQGSRAGTYVKNGPVWVRQ